MWPQFSGASSFDADLYVPENPALYISLSCSSAHPESLPDLSTIGLACGPFESDFKKSMTKKRKKERS